MHIMTKLGRMPKNSSFSTGSEVQITLLADSRENPAIKSATNLHIANESTGLLTIGKKIDHNHHADSARIGSPVFPITNNGLFRLNVGSMKDSWALRDGKPATGGGFYRTRLGGSSGRRVSRRLVHKNGECNVSHVNVPKQRAKYIRDIFTTIIDIKWRWSLLIFATGFLLSWIFFAIVYYIIALAHGDFNPENRANESFSPCIVNLKPHSFVSSFLISLESQHTIGYGHRYITEACPEAVFVLCLQSVIGVMIQAFMAGIIFAKLARPKKRAETLIFSKNAVVYMRDGKMCFLFRVGDMRRTHLVEAHVRLQMIRKKVTMEGEMLAFHQFDMNVGYDEGLDRIFLVWPLTVCHVIDEDSPLYEYSAEDLLNARFEIVAILEGIVESTGMTTQARTSWLPSEILWGQRFEKLVTYQRENGDYKIDYARFHNTYPVDSPILSAKELDERKESGLDVPAEIVGGLCLQGSTQASGDDSCDTYAHRNSVSIASTNGDSPSRDSCNDSEAGHGRPFSKKKSSKGGGPFARLRHRGNCNADDVSANNDDDEDGSASVEKGAINSHKHGVGIKLFSEIKRKITNAGLVPAISGHANAHLHPKNSKVTESNSYMSQKSSTNSLNLDDNDSISHFANHLRPPPSICNSRSISNPNGAYNDRGHGSPRAKHPSVTGMLLTLTEVVERAPEAISSHSQTNISLAPDAIKPMSRTAPDISNCYESSSVSDFPRSYRGIYDDKTAVKNEETSENLTNNCVASAGNVNVQELTDVGASLPTNDQDSTVVNISLPTNLY